MINTELHHTLLRLNCVSAILNYSVEPTIDPKFIFGNTDFILCVNQMQFKLHDDFNFGDKRTRTMGMDYKGLFCLKF